MNMLLLPTWNTTQLLQDQEKLKEQLNDDKHMHTAGNGKRGKM